MQMCRDQILLVDLVEKAFAEEDLFVDEEKLKRYLGLQKHFPYRLLPWESFVFTLHNCTYKQDGSLRWPILMIMVGRGAGKNGYLAFEDFCLITPVNGIKNYDIDIFATSEDQAKATFQDIHDMLEGNELYFEKYFYWTKEEIVNLKTNSHIRYHTSAPKTKDGGRPGKVDFDELHIYENSKLIDVAVTGLGKKKDPRRTFITTQGDVRDGPLDRYVEKGGEYSGEKFQTMAGSISSAGWTAMQKSQTKTPGARPTRPCTILQDRNCFRKFYWNLTTTWTIQPETLLSPPSG